MIEVRNATLGYAGHTVLSQLNFTVRRGDFCIFTGPNGSGKSTVLKAFGGLLSANAGAVVCTAERVGYVPQHVSLDYALLLTVREMLELAYAVTRSWWKGRDADGLRWIRECLERCVAGDLEDCVFSELSGGQRQRVLLARALVLRPDLLLLDEPLAGVDEETQNLMVKLLGELHREKGLTVVLISHEPQMFEGLRARLVRVNHGVLMEMGE